MTDNERIDHILDVIKCLEYFIEGANEEFYFNDNKLQFACYGCLVMITEGSSMLSKEIKQKVKGVDWVLIKKFRNIIIHEYFRIDWQLLWDVIHNNIPMLKLELEKYNK